MSSTSQDTYSSTYEDISGSDGNDDTDIDTSSSFLATSEDASPRHWRSRHVVPPHLLPSVDTDKDVQFTQDGRILIPEHRAMYVDWLRSVSIYLVVFGHILVAIQQADTGRNEVPDRVNIKILGTLRYFVQVMMPLFMYLSGRALAFAKDSPGVLIYKRFTRLIIPMVIGCAVWVIPGQFMAREWRACANANEDRFFHYWVHYWRDDFPCNGFDYLWFLAVLFVLQMFNLPLFLYLRSQYDTRSGRHKTPAPAVSKSAALLGLQGVFVAAVLPGLFLVTRNNANTTTGGVIGFWLFAAAGYVFIIVCATSIAWLQDKLKVFGFYLLFLAFVLPPCFMALLLDDYVEFSEDIIPTIVWHNFFFLGGLIAQMYRVEYRAMKLHRSRQRMMPLGLFFLLVMLGVCCPTDHEDVGYLWRIPLYLNWPNRTLFTIGCWIWLALLTRWGQAFYSERLSQFQYKHLGASSVVVYVSHYFPIIFVQSVIARPNHLWWLYNMLISIVVTLFFTWGLYILLLVIPGVGRAFGLPPPRLGTGVSSLRRPRGPGPSWASQEAAHVMGLRYQRSAVGHLSE